MKSNKLGLYTMDVNYVAELAKVDNKVMSVSPQQHKERRPFVGVVVICNNKEYCIPLTSPKPKHATMKNDKDFMKLSDKDGNPLGAMNFNDMIPVDKRLIKIINVNPSPTDTHQDTVYKNLLQKQLIWCNDNKDIILKRADKLYKLITETPEKIPKLTKRCCDFKKLEAALEKYLIDTGLEKPKQEYIIKKVSEDEFNALKSSGMNFQTAVKDNQRVIRFKAEQKEQVEKIINNLKNKNVLL